MTDLQFKTGKCKISDEWKLNGMNVVYLENDFLKIGVLTGRGSDIFEFIYKPNGLDFMLRLDKGIQNPSTQFSQMRDTPNQLEDYYYGGWQEMLPNSPTFKYRGASLGQHGEVSLIPWKHAIVCDTDQKVALKVWVRPLRIPLLLEKTLTLEASSQVLTIEERLVNCSNTDLDIMWGHHIAFGLPFLEDGGFVETNAKTFESEPLMPDHRKFAKDFKGGWPFVQTVNGSEVDASIIPPAHLEPYSDLSYLSEFSDKANYTLWDQSKKIGFQVSWEADVFSHLWYWQERFATQDAPWWGSAYAVGLELWSSKWTNEPEAAIANGEWLNIKAHEEKETRFTAGVIMN